MSFQEHIARALYAAWRLLSLDKSGLSFLEVSGKGVLRSFAALLFALPLYLLSLYLVTRSPGAGAITSSPLSLLLTGYALGWLVFAFFAFQISRLIGLEARYMRFITVYNWARVFVAILWLPAHALILLGLVSRPAGDILLVVTFGIVFAYRWYIAKAAFGTNAVYSALIVVMDMAFFFAIESAIINWHAPLQ